MKQFATGCVGVSLTRTGSKWAMGILAHTLARPHSNCMQCRYRQATATANLSVPSKLLERLVYSSADGVSLSG